MKIYRLRQYEKSCVYQSHDHFEITSPIGAKTNARTAVGIDRTTRTRTSPPSVVLAAPIFVIIVWVFHAQNHKLQYQ